MAKRFKVIVYVPVADADKIRQVLGEAGGGKIGNYDFCSFSVRGVGRFRPLRGATPAIGVVDKHEEVEEERIEVEVHILDFDGVELYDHEVEVEIEKFFRPNKKFDSKEELIAEMKKDEQTAKEYFRLNSLG